MMTGPQLPPLAPRHDGADWLRSRGLTVSPFGERAAAVLAVAYRGIYHAPFTEAVLDPQSGTFDSPRYVEVRVWGELATYDGHELTRLVLAAHDGAVRVSIRPSSNRTLRIGLAARDRTGGLYYQHPTMEEATERIRSIAYDVPTHALREGTA